MTIDEQLDLIEQLNVEILTILSKNERIEAQIEVEKEKIKFLEDRT